MSTHLRPYQTFMVCVFFDYVFPLLPFLFLLNSFLMYLSFSPTYSSQGQPHFLINEGSLSNIVAPVKKISAACTPPGIPSGCSTVQPSAWDKPVTLEVLTLVPPPQRLCDAEIPLWKVLEGRSGTDTPEKISAKEGTKPLCRG